MPVLGDLGLEVNVLVNGSRATEYPDVEHGLADDGYDEAIPRTFHYIESKDETEFSIKVTSTKGAVDNWLGASPGRVFLFYVDLDGDQVSFEGTTLDPLSRIISGVKDYSGDRVSLRAFRFAKVSTVDDAGKKQVASDTEKSRRLGTISVRAYRATYIDLNTPPFSKSTTTLAEGGVISLAEKALKGRALSHGSTLSPATYKHKPNSSRYFTLLDSRECPLAIFHFKYRSKDALQQEMIVPRPRSISVDSDIDQLPDEEVRRLALEYLAEKRERRKRSVTVKAEPGQVPRSKRPLKVSKTKRGMVTIDLTEDD